MDSEPYRIASEVHPDFAGAPTVRELLTGFWPYTQGRRLTLAVLQLLSLVLFALAASVPIQVGSLLSAALSRRSDDGSLHTYVLEPLAIRQQALAALQHGWHSSSEERAAATAIDALQAQTLSSNVESILQKLFPTTQSYMSGSIAAIDEPSQPWEKVVVRVTADGIITRYELAALAKSAPSDPSAGKAFGFIAGSLLTDRAGQSARSEWYNARFRWLLLRLSGTLAGVLALRLVNLRLTQRGVLWASRRLQDSVFARVHDTPLLDARALARTSMVSRCTSYIERSSNAVTRLFTIGVPSAAALVLSIALLVWIDPWVGLLVVGFVVAFEVIRRFISPRWSRRTHERFDLNTELAELTDRSIGEGTEIRALHVEPRVRHEFAVQAERVVRHTRSVETFAEIFHLSAFAVGQFAVLTAIAVVGYLRRDLNLAEAAAVVLYVREVTSALDALPSTIVELQEAAPAMRRLRRVLAAPLRNAHHVEAATTPADTTPVDTTPADTTSTEHTLRITGVNVAVPHAMAALNNITATFRQGLNIVVGERADATLLLHLVEGLESPMTGSISRSGHSALVTTSPLVLQGSIFENLTLCEPDANPNYDDNAIHHVLTVARRWGLHQMWTLEECSDLRREIGQHRHTTTAEARARLGFARAELTGASIVLIDDPTIGFPPATVSELWRLVRHVFEEMIVVVATEQFDIIEPFDQVTVLRAGSIEEVGSCEALLASGRRFSRVWTHYMHGGPTVARLAEVPMFADLDDETLASLASRLATERFDAGDTIFNEGERADRMFLIVDGDVELIGQSGAIARMGRGDFFGDLGGSTPTLRRQFAARALTPVVAQSIHRDAISSGASGVLELPTTQRALFAHLARYGETTAPSLAEITGYTAPEIDSALSALLAKGLVRRGVNDDGITFRVAPTLTRRAPLSSALNQLADL